MPAEQPDGPWYARTLAHITPTSDGENEWSDKTSRPVTACPAPNAYM